MTPPTPGLAGHVHYLNGEPWCDGVNHTTMCQPESDEYDPWMAQARPVTPCAPCSGAAGEEIWHGPLGCPIVTTGRADR